MEGDFTEDSATKIVQVVERREKDGAAEPGIARFGIYPRADEQKDTSKILETRPSIGNGVATSFFGLGRDGVSGIASVRQTAAKDQSLGRRASSGRSVFIGLARQRF